MAYFPFMIEVKGHKALVVGAGQSAKYKIRALSEFGADVTVVAPVISADVVKQGKNVRIERRVYRPGETKGYEIVVAATDNSAVNKQVAHDAARFGAICTVADDPLRGGFIFPAIIKKDNYSVAISTDGKSPLLAKRLKETIEDALPEKADDMVALLGNARKSITESEGTPEEHKQRLADLADAEVKTIEADKEETLEEKTARISSEEGEVIRVGSRESRLAQAQTDTVISMLTAKGYVCEKVLFKTTGDKMLDRPLQEFGGKAVFVTEIEDALLNGKKVYCPSCEKLKKSKDPVTGGIVRDGGVMDFYRIRSMQDLSESNFGIPEPKKISQNLYRGAEPALMIMPGIAFDIKRNRVGYKGGYYDRYLNEHGHFGLHTLAIAFDAQVVPSIPASGRDVKPSVIVTESRII